MKKLISAAAAMAMAASMVGSAVPFATGAADSSKSLYFDIVTGRDGKTKASTTISKDDITAGDVTIPVGLFLGENAKDTKAFQAEWTINAADGGDAASVSFKQCAFSSKYYSADQTIKVGDTELTTNSLVGFAGKVEDDPIDGAYWSAYGKNTASCRPNSDVANTKNAFGSFIWTGPTDGVYNYSGAKSDDYPAFVFEVTFPKGTKAGTYTIDFLNYEYKDVPSTYLQNGSTLVPGSGIDTKSITFTIEGDKVDPPSTTTTPPQTTKAPETTTTKTPVDPGDDEYRDDFTLQPDAVTAKPGETIKNVPVIIDSNGRDVATLVYELPKDLPDGWKIEPASMRCYCFDEKFEFSLQAETYTAFVTNSENGHSSPVIDKKPMIYVNITVPADAAPGDYEYFFSRFYIVEESNVTSRVAYNGNVLPGKITIEGDTPAETTTKTPVGTTTKAPDTTKKPDTTTTKTPGKVLYGDANDNGEVNIADVVVLNKWLHNNEDYAMTDQGKINANCCDVSADKINAEDSDAIIKSIVSLVTLPCAASDLK